MDWAHVASNRYRCWAHVHVVMQFYYVHIPCINQMYNCKKKSKEALGVMNVN